MEKRARSDDSPFPIPHSRPATLAKESAGQSRRAQAYRGKSGLHRAECQVTPGQRELTASATESRPPMARRGTGKGERVR